MTRLSVNINDKTRESLEAIAERRGITVTEVVRRAVSVYKFVADESEAGKTLQLWDPEQGEATRLVVL